MPASAHSVPCPLRRVFIDSAQPPTRPCCAWPTRRSGLRERGEHHGQVRLDRVTLVVEDRAGAQVAVAHPERLLYLPQVVVGGDHRGHERWGRRRFAVLLAALTIATLADATSWTVALGVVRVVLAAAGLGRGGERCPGARCPRRLRAIRLVR